MTTANQNAGRRFIVAVIGLGLLAAAASAVVPFYSASYRLDVGILAAGLMPYLVYGVLGWIAPRGVVLHLVASLALFGHLWLVVSDRFMNYNGYQDGTIYYVPMGFAVILLVLGVMSAHREGTRLAPQ